MNGQTDPYTQRILTRLRTHPHGGVLSDLLAQEDVRRDMADRARRGMKPITALSEPLIERIGTEAAKDNSLRQIAGEATAWVMENRLGFVRCRGSREIVGDPVFASGQPFAESPEPEAPPAAGDGMHGDAEDGVLLALLAAMGRHDLERLGGLVRSEHARRYG